MLTFIRKKKKPTALGFVLLEDATSHWVLEDGTSRIALEGNP